MPNYNFPSQRKLDMNEYNSYEIEKGYSNWDYAMLGLVLAGILCMFVVLFAELAAGI